MSAPPGLQAFTERQLRDDLAALGVTPGCTLIVHSSLRAVGRVEGGAAAVVAALVDAVGREGNLAMPAATPQCAAPPPFDAATTPTTMGAIAEAFRTWPGTRRSDHPLESVCARGARAAEIVRDHPLAFSEGPGTPFARLHDLDAWILLLGVGFNRCTALHFAESLAPKRRTMTVRFPRGDGAAREWIEVPNVADDLDTHFPEIGARYLATGRARLGTIGAAGATLVRMRDLVAVALAYFDEVL